MGDDICRMSVAEQAARFRDRSLSPVAAARAALARASAQEERLNAFVMLTEDEALAQARASEARWAKGEPLSPIDGVPTTVKDLVAQKGLPFRRGSLATTGEPAEEDSPAVQSLREAGAVLIGKTTTPEFGCLGVTNSPYTGITRNPWDESRTSGGSSGGAAASVAVGAGTLALGTDGGGSIRMPAAFCGIFGLKPTMGRVPYSPPSAVGSNSCVGPMTRTVADAAAMLTVMARPDPRDWLGATDPAPDYAALAAGGVKGFRICYSPTLSGASVDAPMAEAARRSAEAFASLGAEVVEREQVIDDCRRTFEAYFFVGMARAWRAMGKAQREVVGPEFREMAEEGARLGLFDYADAEQARAALGVRVGLLLDEFDLLLTPQLTLTAFQAGLEYPSGRGWRRWVDWAPFTYPFNLTHHPAASVPNGFGPDGMPTAFQLVGQRGADGLVLRAATAYEAAHPFRLPPV